MLEMAKDQKISLNKPSYLQEVAAFHIDSFDFVLNKGLNAALLDIDPVHTATKYNCKISIAEVDVKQIDYPMDTRKQKKVVYPAEIRERKETYYAQLLIGLKFETETHVETHSRVFFIPLMVKSDICRLKGLTDSDLIRRKEDPNDPGGYFIINGTEKIIRTFIVSRRNYPLGFINDRWKLIGKGYSQFAVFTSCIKENHTISDIYLHYVNSHKDKSHPSAEVCVYYYGRPYFIPFILLLKALVVESDIFVVKAIKKFNNDPSLTLFVKNMFYDLHDTFVPLDSDKGICTHLQAKNFIGKLFYPVFKGAPNASYSDVTDHLLKSCVFIHLEKNEDKFSLFCFCISKLFALAKNQCMSEDRDNPAFQEVLLPGQTYLMAVKHGVSYFLNSVRNSLRKKIEKKMANSEKVLNEKDFGRCVKDMVISSTNKASSFTPIVKNFVSTGHLPGKHGLWSSTGYTVTLGRTNVFEVASQFNGVYKFSMSFYPKNMRKFYPESWGFLCPAHSPEGENMGLYNHLALSCKIVNLNSPPVDVKLLFKLGIVPFDDPYTACNLNKSPILVDGKMVGWISNIIIPSVLDKIKFLRSAENSFIPNYTEIVHISKGEHCTLFPGIYLFSTPCRFIRQIQNNENLNYELIGSFEQATTQVNIFGENDADYSEINDSNFLGMAAAVIPFGENNPAHRNIYTTCKSNQAVSFPFSNSRFRSDTKSMFLTNPQLPIVSTSEYAKYNWNENPTGINLSLAIISYSGFDMEDAVVLNKSSVERGLLQDFVYKTVVYDLEELAKQDNSKVTELVFQRDPKQPHLSQYLDADGTPYIGGRVEKGSPVLSVFSTKSKQFLLKTYENRRAAYVDAVKFMGTSLSSSDAKLPAETRKIAITYCTKRTPVVGDKFSNRQSQKGICAAILPSEDLPFSLEGSVPDILFNPHSLSSRMSVGMLLEILASVAGLSKSKREFVVPFMFSEKTNAAEYFGNILKDAGLDSYGTQRFYSGTSGEELEAEIFCGYAYYFRLKHVVEEKYQVGSVAKDVDSKTMQPLNIDKAGAVRFGEMEKDAVLSHGAMNLTLDRLLLNSDACKAFICEECKQMLFPVTRPPNLDLKIGTVQENNTCEMCQRTSKCAIRVPYVLVYLISELSTVGIKFQFSFE